ncbi:MAG: PEP-CTERM sorting domain-containing protein, partial [Pirellulaceae bacterium]|nr:PEP-CTERM sorting domain-containing protein [Pirellulaceae bacterium]
TGAGRIEKVGAGTLAMADLGAGPAGDLVLGGGTFRYTGATATTNRGLSTTGAATIDVAGSDATLTLTGSVTTTGGGTLTKVGEGTIEFAGPAGTHALATGQVNVNGGSLAFGGTNGATYDINNTRTYIGVGGTTGTMELSGNATVTNTSSVHSYVGQGAGSVGTLSLTDQAQMVVTNTNADTWAGQLWVGRNAGATGTINLSGGTSTENPGAKLIVTGMSDIGSYGPSGETPAGKGYLNVHDYAQMETRGLVMGDGGEGYLLIDGNGKVTSTGNQWLRFGFFPTGVFEGELKDNATLHGTGAMYLGDDRGTATLTLTSPTTEGDGATLQVNGTLYVGNNGNDTDTTDGTLYINEGTAVNVGGHLYVGAADNANGTVIMNGGSLTTGNWLNIGRTGGGTNGATGTLTMNGNASAHAGGTFFAGNAYNGGSGTVTLNDNAQISSGTDICVAWGGIGVLNVGDGTEPVGEDTGAVATAGTYIRLTDSGNLSNATLNLNVGGTVETPYIDTNSTHASSSAVMNFDGGTLRALENTSANAFIGNTGNVASFALNVKAGGAKIDSNGFDVVVNPDLVEDAGSTGGGLTKLGEGNLTLGGANTYTGDTRIEGGSLTTFAPSLNDFADVWISNGALFDLDFLGPDTIGALFLGGVSQALGTYGSSLSGATYQLDDYFSGTGMLLVTELTFVQIPGDADGDMKVDAVDAKRLAENWGATSLNPSYTTMWEMGDFNGDGKIDAKDASILAAQWGDYTSGSSESQGTAVPEPGMLALLLGLALAGLARRVRR